ARPEPRASGDEPCARSEVGVRIPRGEADHLDANAKVRGGDKGPRCGSAPGPTYSCVWARVVAFSLKRRQLKPWFPTHARTRPFRQSGLKRDNAALLISGS